MHRIQLSNLSPGLCNGLLCSKEYIHLLFKRGVCVQERRHRSKLPRALRGLMGEANIRYARGEKDDAILMCMEIIRQGECVC